jgi:hypothetical protein
LGRQGSSADLNFPFADQLDRTGQTACQATSPGVVSAAKSSASSVEFAEAELGRRLQRFDALMASKYVFRFTRADERVRGRGNEGRDGDPRMTTIRVRPPRLDCTAKEPGLTGRARTVCRRGRADQ